MRAIRFERTLNDRLSNSAEILGKVQWIFQNGFYVSGSDDRPICFLEGNWLSTPFGIVVDRPLDKWMKRVFLRKGDHLLKKGSFIYRWPQNDCFIRLLPEEVVDLNRPLYDSPPGREITTHWIECLIEALLNRGHFEGIGGALILLKEQFPGLIGGGTVPLSSCSRYALSTVSSMIESTTNGDLAGFVNAWERLVGLGPGLTPSGDDFLVGFLASHRILSSRFGKRLRNPELQKTLGQLGWKKTTPVAAEFLYLALEGILSETLYHVFETFASNGPKNAHGPPIKAFLNWGHSSGTDTLAGVILGLSTLH